MFFKESNEIDLGQTTISNVFIDLFMPMTNGLYVQVYLLGFKVACDAKNNENFSNSSIAKNLNVPLSDVDKAWDFWQKKGIVKIKNKIDDDLDYCVEFLDLNKFYMENIYNPSMKYNTSIKSNVNEIVNLVDDNTRIMFNSINKIIGRQLDQKEKIELLDIKERYNMTNDMIIIGYEYIRDKGKTPKPVVYMEKIFRNWYDSNLYTLEDIENSLLMESKKRLEYKTIFRELGFHRSPSKKEEEIMDDWLNDFDMETILFACSKSINTSNPSITFINGTIQKWKENNLKTIDDIKKYEEEKQNKNKINKQNINYPNKNKDFVPKVTTRYHNLSKSYEKYSAKELEQLLRESQKNKFK